MKCPLAQCSSEYRCMEAGECLHIKPKNPHAVALGRKGGAATKGITSEAKKLATRANLEKARAAKAEKLKSRLAYTTE